MKITITTLDDLVITLDVSNEMELENLKALCALEINMEQKRIAVFFNGHLLNDPTKTLAQYGINDGDMLLVKNSSNLITDPGMALSSLLPQQITPSALPVSNHQATDDRTEAINIFATLQSNPEKLATLRVNNPRLAEAFDKGLEEFINKLKEQQEARAKEEQRRIRMLLADPFDSEAQQMIADEIRRQQVDSNMESAMEYLPESFGEVTMLYINCKVNGFPIKAFVDSGAQSTIMSNACAERCNILRLIDDRWAGIAQGVGTQRIMGKIHLVQLEINGYFLPSSFLVLEHQPMDMLLGLDMLRRHQCAIDLKANVLRIGTTGTETKFLSESEIPKLATPKVEDLIKGDIQKAIQESLKVSSTNNGYPKTNSSLTSSQSSSNENSTSSVKNSSTTSSSSSISRHSEADIQELISKGFNREQVISELDACNGDKIQALAALFAKSIIVPDNI